MALKQLKTPWGENLTDKPLQEYPRPQFVRKSYVNLNGYWEYAITQNEYFPIHYDGKILVPFSPDLRTVPLHRPGCGALPQPDLRSYAGPDRYCGRGPGSSF